MSALKNILAIIGAILVIHGAGIESRDKLGGWQAMKTAPRNGKVIEIRPIGISWWSPWVKEFTYQSDPWDGSCGWGWYQVDDPIMGIIESDINSYRWRLPTETR